MEEEGGRGGEGERDGSQFSLKNKIKRVYIDRVQTRDVLMAITS